MLTGVRNVEIVELGKVGAPGPGEILVETLYSGISAGTDLTQYRGTNPQFEKRYDPEYHLFFRHDAEAEPAFPRKVGYENVGRVVAVGRDVTAFSEGDLVFSCEAHITRFKSNPSLSFLLPEGLPPRNGLYFALLAVAYNAILDAGILPGETVAIFGMGVIGQLTVQMARQAGAGKVIAVDLIESRLQKARISGADELVNPSVTDDVARHVRDLTGRRGPDVVVDASGSTLALNEAIRTARVQGRVIVVSFLVGEAKGLYLGEEFHHNRIRIISSQASGVNPLLHPRWDHQRKLTATMAMLPKLKLEHLLTHEFRFQDAAKAFELLDAAPQEALQVVLTYPTDQPDASTT